MRTREGCSSKRPSRAGRHRSTGKASCEPRSRHRPGLQDYLAAHPGGRHRDTAEQRVLQLDSEEFDRAVKSDSAEAYRKYLASNAGGMFVEEAGRRRDVALDRKAFAQAKARHTIEAYTSYLNSRPTGSYRSQAQAAARKLKDPLLFARAKLHNTIESYEKYLKEYPDGDHAAEARLKKDQVHVAGRVFRDCDTCPAMVVLPAGSFVMGSDDGDEDERPLHRVTIEKPFAVGKYEVTLGQFRSFVQQTGHDMGEKEGLFGLPAPDSCESPRMFAVKSVSWRAPGYNQDNRSPAVCVNWNDAATYAAWLSKKTGKPYRLLSEAEWEYAARATTRSAFHFGEYLSPDRANYNSSHTEILSKGKKYRKRAIKVGSFATNGFGLYDMHGNVLEWVEDCWHDNYEGAPTGEARGRRREIATFGSYAAVPGSTRPAICARLSQRKRGEEAPNALRIPDCPGCRATGPAFDTGPFPYRTVAGEGAGMDVPRQRGSRREMRARRGVVWRWVGRAVIAVSTIGLPLAAAGAPAERQETRLFAAHALALRTGGLQGDPATMDMLAAMPASGSARATRALWPPFFENAIVKLGRLRSPTPVALYYNPLLDVALITFWRRTQGRYSVTSIRALPGERLARPGIAVTEQPAWLLSGDPVSELMTMTEARLSGFRRSHPASGLAAARDEAGFASAADDLRTPAAIGLAARHPNPMGRRDQPLAVCRPGRNRWNVGGG